MNILGAAVTVKVTQDPTFGLEGTRTTLGQYTLNLRGKGSQTGSLYTLTDESHEHSTLTVGLKLVCDQDYYGRNCHVHCPAPRPADHYTCNQTTGHKQCNPGTPRIQNTGLEYPRFKLDPDPSYTGSECNETKNTTPCSHNNCKNGGTCVTKGSVYTCHCPTGYSGSMCQTTPCSNNPCLNKGTCSVQGTKYSCQCPTGYSGTRCETTPCTNNHNCKNGGTCVTKGSVYTCQCPTGYSGTRCETTPCTNNHNCKNGGTCVTKGSVYTCHCPTGYSVYTCHCPNGYNGTRCQTTPCSSSPCKNNGTCNFKGLGYNCSCISGYIGKECEINIDECSRLPCQNGGTCIDGINRYDCRCKAGFSGSNCNHDIDECTSRPCMNGGTCQDKVNEFSCHCVSGFTGPVCDAVISTVSDRTATPPTASTSSFFRRSLGTTVQTAFVAKLYLQAPVGSVDNTRLKTAVISLLTNIIGSPSVKDLNISLSMKGVYGQNGEHVTEVSINIKFSTKVVNSEHISSALQDLSKHGDTLPYKMYVGNVRNTPPATSTTNAKHVAVIAGVSSALGVLVLVIVVYLCRRRRRTPDRDVQVLNNVTIDGKHARHATWTAFENPIFEPKYRLRTDI
ncbi:neurogenic locus notch homolog protein 2-like [Gigantopelta aegis]|uniref:neurogenic locus notch homolog protein 2-like n=1 Tax=Gigantopelta aegis TaxID=1735272 RepID=UPI001B887881|nr:neurogenic locus notch homolog protein 2-like [Gigantopelta aegis]